ncbi:hypothetical protein Q3G72_028483 [Acer saccharum]|nr:hypothetical protein Q3G72_028483 [Acer saccharum]
MPLVELEVEEADGFDDKQGVCLSSEPSVSSTPEQSVSSTSSSSSTSGSSSAVLSKSSSHRPSPPQLSLPSDLSISSLSVFRISKAQADDVVPWVCSFLADFKNANVLKAAAGSSSNPPVVPKWCPPVDGVYKIDTDAAIAGLDRRVGIGIYHREELEGRGHGV